MWGETFTSQRLQKEEAAEKGIRVSTRKRCLREENKQPKQGSKNVDKPCQKVERVEILMSEPETEGPGLGKEERAGCPHPWGRGEEGGSRRWLSSGGALSIHPSSLEQRRGAGRPSSAGVLDGKRKAPILADGDSGRWREEGLREERD